MSATNGAGAGESDASPSRLPDLDLLIGMDAGKGTGIAWVANYNGQWLPETFGSEEVHGRLQVWKFLLDLTSSGRTFILVAEKFVLSERTTKTTRQYDTLYLNGFAEGTVSTHGYEYHELTPAESKGFADDPKLRRLDWFRNTPDGHANDAARLVLTGAFRHTPDMCDLLARRLTGETS